MASVGFNPAHINGWTVAADYTSAQTNTSLKAAVAATVSIAVDQIVISNDGTAAITWKLLDGSGGTNKTGTQKLAASSHAVINFAIPIVLTLNTALCLTTTGTSNFSVFVAGHQV